MNGVEALAEFYVAMAPRVFPERYPELTAPVELMDSEEEEWTEERACSQTS